MTFRALVYSLQRLSSLVDLWKEAWWTRATPQIRPDLMFRLQTFRGHDGRATPQRTSRAMKLSQWKLTAQVMDTLANVSASWARGSPVSTSHGSAAFVRGKSCSTMLFNGKQTSILTRADWEQSGRGPGLSLYRRSHCAKSNAVLQVGTRSDPNLGHPKLVLTKEITPISHHITPSLGQWLLMQMLQARQGAMTCQMRYR